MQILKSEAAATHLTDQESQEKLDEIKRQVEQGKISEEEGRQERDGLRGLAARQED